MTTIAAPSMTESFKALNEANVPYVVVQGYNNLPNIEPDRVVILVGCTADRAARVLGATKNPDHPKGHFYQIDGIRTKFYIMEKGGAFFPESFESSMLARRQLHSNVYRAVFHDVMYAHLYWKLYREGGWKNNPEFQTAVQMMLDNLVGGVVPAPDFWDAGLVNGQLLTS